METLPPPSPEVPNEPPVPPVPPVPPPPVRHLHVPRPGDLTTAWRVVTGIGWLGIVIVLAATWNASRQLGLPTWWLGPVDHQRPPYVILLPFIAPAVIIAAVGNRVRYVPWIGVVGATAIAAVGLGDLGRVRGLGVVELIAAGAGLLVSVASLTGMYRAADAVEAVEAVDAVEAVEPDAIGGSRGDADVRHAVVDADRPSG